MRTDRKYYPKTIMKADKDLQKSEFDFAQSGNIGVAKWKDRGTKCVSIASSIYNPCETTTVSRRNQKGDTIPVNCPKMISCYNKYMRG